MFSGLFERFLEERSEGVNSGLTLPKDKTASWRRVFCRVLTPDGRSSNDICRAQKSDLCFLMR